ILVVPQRVPENYVKSTISIGIENRLGTIKQQVLSRTRLVAVMDELGLFKEDRKKNPVEEVVEEMRKRITIEVRHTDAFTLSFVHENRQTAMLTTARLASFFIDENLKNREQQAVGTADFLESQLQETKKKLEEQEERVKRYKSTYMGELPQQLQANLAVMSRLQDQLKANADAIRTAQDRRMFIESQISTLESQVASFEAQARAASGGTETAATEPVSPSDPAAPYLPELKAKRAQLASLSTRYTGEYPEIRRLKEEIEILEKQVAAARGNPSPIKGTSGGSTSARPLAEKPPYPLSREREEIRRLRTVLQALDLEIQSLKENSAEIRKNVAAVESRVERSPKREQEMISLTRDYDNLKRSYDELLKKKLDADISQNLEKRQKGEQFQILDPANLPEEPFIPNRPKVFGIAVLAALLLGFGGAVGLEMIDPSARGAKEFSHFSGIPVLASIPSIHDKAYAKKAGRRRAAVFGGLITFTTAVTVFLLVYGEKVRSLLVGAR
ncbi:GNVR domain-containing protein, partial [Candidatus Deferrimicrobium sp.]|uniref:GNVR domain-containing protein n=1 Tax=Candidatus Deferrimicrobium sp. TaxID=3060586 RepID=UPI003C49CB97